MPFTEANFENAIIELLRDHLEYDYVYGPDVVREYTQPLHMKILRESLRHINHSAHNAAIEEAITKISTFETGTLVQKNATFTDYLQNGVEVNYYNGKTTESTRIRLIDYDNPLHNNFTVTNQWTVEEHSVKRPDIIVFINGLPLVVMELKSPSREQTDVSEAYRQLRNYMHEIPTLFAYNAFCVMSDQATSKAGTITSGDERFMEWKTADGTREEHRFANFEVLFQGMCDRARLIEIIQNFICYSDNKKILASYHQFYAVKKAVKSTIAAVWVIETLNEVFPQQATPRIAAEPSMPYGNPHQGRSGVFLHTNGSGKSLSMVLSAKLLQQTI